MLFLYSFIGDLSIKGYTNASFQTNNNYSCLQSGFVFLMNVGVVTWRRSKKDTMADLMMVSEFIATNEVIKDDMSLKKFISNLGVVPRIGDHVEIFYDEGAISLTKEPMYHKFSPLHHEACIRRHCRSQSVIGREPFQSFDQTTVAYEAWES